MVISFLLFIAIDIFIELSLTDLEILKKFYDEVMMLAGIKEYHNIVVAIYRKLVEIKNK